MIKRLNEFLDKSRFGSNGWITYSFIFGTVLVIIAILLGMINMWYGLPLWMLAVFCGSSILRLTLEGVWK